MMSTLAIATDYSPKFKRGNSNKVLLCLILVLGIMIVGALATGQAQTQRKPAAAAPARVSHSLSAHAVNKHALAADVNRCGLDPAKIGIILTNEQTGRRATLCEFRPGEWGRIIDEANGDNVTAFANETRATANEWGHAIRNLVKHGYRKLQFIRSDLIDSAADALAQP